METHKSERQRSFLQRELTKELAHEHSGLSCYREKVRDVPMVAGRARNRNAQLPALLCEGRGWARSVHGAERPAKDARDYLSKMEQVGKTVKDEELFSRHRGMMMPHVT